VASSELEVLEAAPHVFSEVRTLKELRAEIMEVSILKELRKPVERCVLIPKGLAGID
jgi:hypothetical protein